MFKVTFRSSATEEQGVLENISKFKGKLFYLHICSASRIKYIYDNVLKLHLASKSPNMSKQKANAPFPL